jgi:Skp family chaperone for outer membrane proteins
LKKAVVSFIGWGATSLGAAVCFLESLHRGSLKEVKTELKGSLKEVKTELKGLLKEVKTELKEVKTDLKVLMQDVAFIKGALTGKRSKRRLSGCGDE